MSSRPCTRVSLIDGLSVQGKPERDGQDSGAEAMRVRERGTYHHDDISRAFLRPLSFFSSLEQHRTVLIMWSRLFLFLNHVFDSFILCVCCERVKRRAYYPRQCSQCVKLIIVHACLFIARFLLLLKRIRSRK